VFIIHNIKTYSGRESDKTSARLHIHLLERVRTGSLFARRGGQLMSWRRDVMSLHGLVSDVNAASLAVLLLVHVRRHHFLDVGAYVVNEIVSGNEFEMSISRICVLFDGVRLDLVRSPFELCRNTQRTAVLELIRSEH